MEQTFYALDEQQKRRHEINCLAAQYNLACFNDAGVWVKPGWSPGMRENVWFAMCFLESGEPRAVRAANAILLRQHYVSCHFTPMYLMLILRGYAPLLEPGVRPVIDNYLGWVLDEFLSPDNDFVGVNDNFPSMATFIALMGGSLYDKPALYQKGKERLGQLAALLTRRGVASEYDSPTYAPGQIYPMSQIANCIDDAEIRATALQCEARLWADLLGHVHRETFQVAGPFSRAYTVDSTGHTHQSRFLLYMLFGDALTVNVKNTLLSAPDGQAGEVPHNSIPFLQESAGWMLNTTYHCPAWLAELALHKQYPYQFIASTEFSSSTDAPAEAPQRDPAREEELYEYPAGHGRISTYMTADYALGVASHEFHSGNQTDSFHILYRRARPVQTQRDICTVYARYLFGAAGPQVQSSSLPDDGRKLGVQHENTALMLYKPKLYGRRGATYLRLSLILPVLGHKLDRVVLGDRELENAEGESAASVPVFIKDGSVCMAFYPTALTDYGRKAAVRVENRGDFILISFINYEGAPRNFAARGFLLTRSGFAAEVRSEEECGGFEALCRRPVSLRDEWRVSPHSRQTYIRMVRYAREGLTLETEYSPVSEGVKHITVNGHALYEPKLHISGFDVSRLPFMEEPQAF